MTDNTTETPLREALASRILLLDGAMGTMIQSHKLSDAEFRGERFADFPHELSGNSDLLSLTQPDIIRNIHRAYLEAGADIGAVAARWERCQRADRRQLLRQDRLREAAAGRKRISQPGPV